ncbi:hypothetical protein GUT189_16540 [Streptococcus ruminantium]|nr:hypothetical protein GUT189_16540 [Streptococcus ruminantium]
MPLNEAFSDEFRRFLSGYLVDYEETFIKHLTKHMNSQNRESDLWKIWTQTEEYQIRRTDREKKIN